MPFVLSPSRKIFGLVDCNNFFASCERVINPSLAGKPVVVLSNNDGCAVARSNEAKALGIKMGQPFFQWRHLLKEKGVIALSANFALYGDLSRRVMETLGRFSPDQEVYSIDEAFLGLETLGIKAFVEYGRDIRRTVLKDTGLPVSVGIASTKTLSKLANHTAKTHPEYQGVCSLLEEQNSQRVMQELPVSEVWGIGGQKARVLTARGIRTILDLRNADDRWIRKNMSVVTLRTVFELRGISCIGLEDIPAPRQTIGISRTFPRDIHSLEEIESIVCGFTSHAAQKMRAQGQITGFLQVFAGTSPFKPDYYANSGSVRFDPRTDYTPGLTSAVRQILGEIYQPGRGYKRAGVVLGDFSTRTETPLELFVDTQARERQEKLMAVVDQLNTKVAKGAVFFAGEYNR
jgi:DNA polymerase V